MPLSAASERAPPSFADIQAAVTRLEGKAVLTPLLESAAVNLRVGGRVLLKAESLQRTGSFKFRGAYNAMAQLDTAQRRSGVVAFSSGNHAQGVAAAAQLLGISATIVMPADAPAIKLGNTRALGAQIVLYDRRREDREAIATRIMAERKATLIPPYDDARVIAGQGTVGLEVAAQAALMGTRLEAVVVPCSGGGLAAGCALALRAGDAKIDVYAAEPDGFDDTRLSLATGTRLSADPKAQSICDALQVRTPGALTFSLNSQLLAGGVAVSDAEVLQAMAVAFAEYKIVLEPSGAVALAAVLTAKLPVKGRTVAVIASGGNVDREIFARALTTR